MCWLLSSYTIRLNHRRTVASGDIEEREYAFAQLDARHNTRARKGGLFMKNEPFKGLPPQVLKHDVTR